MDATQESRTLLQSSETPPSNATMNISIGAQLDNDLTSLWLLVCAFLVFFMQSGFALLEAGTVRLKNTRNILTKNVIDVCVAALTWWAIGYPFSHGSCGSNGFIGYEGFFTAKNSIITDIYYAEWMFGLAFAATASTIVSGAVAERIQFKAYVVYTTLLSAVVYPVVAHWIWSTPGWLSARRADCTTGEPTPYFAGTTGLLDFAGSGVVHMVGGAAALAGAYVTGPRLGRFSKEGFVTKFENASTSNMVLGVLILWLGWYGFNAGSTGCMYGCMKTAALAAVNTTLSIAAGGISCLFLSVSLGKPGDVGDLLNGLLAGAVSATANCALVMPYAAVVIGLIGGAIYMMAASLLVRLKIDDPVDAAPVHLFCGAWGLIATGLFATETSVQNYYGYAYGWGVFYGSNGTQLGIQILGALLIFLWSFGLSFLMFLALKKTGNLRVSKENEEKGMDLLMGIGTGTRFKCFSKFMEHE